MFFVKPLKKSLQQKVRERTFSHNTVKSCKTNLPLPFCIQKSLGQDTWAVQGRYRRNPGENTEDFRVGCRGHSGQDTGGLQGRNRGNPGENTEDFSAGCKGNSGQDTGVLQGRYRSNPGEIQKTSEQDAGAIQGRIQGYSRVDTGAIQVKIQKTSGVGCKGNSGQVTAVLQGRYRSNPRENTEDFMVGCRGNSGQDTGAIQVKCMCFRNEFSTTLNAFLRGTKNLAWAWKLLQYKTLSEKILQKNWVA